MPHSIFRFAEQMMDAPSSKISGEAQRDDAPAAEESISTENEKRRLAKQVFDAVEPGRPGQAGTQAHIDIYRHVPTQQGSKSGTASLKAKVSGTPIQEYRFIITNTNFQNAERFSVRSTFGDAPEIAHSFGEKPKIWTFNGILRSGTGNTQWRRAMEAFYHQRLRPTKMMRDNEFVRFRVGDLSLRGYILSFTTSQSEKMDDAMARFNFSMYVRSFNVMGGYRYEPASSQLAADAPPLDEFDDVESIDIEPVEPAPLEDL